MSQSTSLEKSTFERMGDRVAEHELMQRMAAGELPLEQWRNYVLTRLSAGGEFVNFLTSIEAQSGLSNAEDIQAAVRSNLNEELGFSGGTQFTDRMHSTWRGWCRDEMCTILGRKGVATDGIALPDTRFYADSLRGVSVRRDLFEMCGALVALEIAIAREYEQVLLGADKQFSELSAQALMYWRSHAHHDHRHFDEIFGPLAELCTTPEDVDRAMTGAQLMQDVKIRFMDAILDS